MDDDETLYNLLKEAFLLLDFGDRQFLSQYALTVPRYYTLVHINEEPGTSLSNLSDRMFCDKSNTTRLVKSLEAEGYIMRKRHETDGRTFRLFLTPKGTAVCQQITSAHQQYNQQRLNHLGADQASLIRQLQHLNQNLKEELAEEHSQIS